MSPLFCSVAEQPEARRRCAATSPRFLAFAPGSLDDVNLAIRLRESRPARSKVVEHKSASSISGRNPVPTKRCARTPATMRIPPANSIRRG